MIERINKQFIETILDGSPGMVYILNLETSSIEYSTNISNSIAGYSPEEVNEMGNTFLEKIIHADDIPKVKQVLQTIRKSITDKTTIVEYRYIQRGIEPKENDYPWCKSYLKPIERNTKNEVIRVCGIAIEISTLKHTELELYSKNTILSTIAKFNPTHIIITDAKTNMITYSSRSLEDTIGYSVIEDEDQINLYEIVGQIMLPDDFIELIKVWQDIIDFGRPIEYNTEIRIYGLHKDFRWYTYSCSPYEKDSHSNVKSLIHFTTEITKWKKTELKLKTTIDDLEQFAYVSSHDLKQPLNTIESSLKLLLPEIKNQDDNTNIMNAIDKIAYSARVMRNNIQAILK